MTPARRTTPLHLSLENLFAKSPAQGGVPLRLSYKRDDRQRPLTPAGSTGLDCSFDSATSMPVMKSTTARRYRPPSSPDVGSSPRPSNLSAEVTHSRRATPTGWAAHQGGGRHGHAVAVGVPTGAVPMGPDTGTRRGGQTAAPTLNNTIEPSNCERASRPTGRRASSRLAGPVRQQL